MRIQENGNVGIGTNSPDRLLTVNGGWLGVYGQGASSGYLLKNIDNNKVWDVSLQGSDLAINETGQQSPLYLKAGGNVGIGIINPQNRLDINGSSVIGSSYAGNTSAPTDGLLVQGKVGIGTTAPVEKLEVSGNIKVNGNILFFTGNKLIWSTESTAIYGNGSISTISFYTNLANRLHIDSNGCIGINRATPLYKLDVNGSEIRINDGANRTVFRIRDNNGDEHRLGWDHETRKWVEL